MDVTVLGCRGSTPATGAAFDRYGGDTSSVAVARSGEAPTLVLDAGTGLRRLAELACDSPFRGAILLSHLHWDHTHGLPFCGAVDHPEAEVDLYLPAQDGNPRDLLARAIGPPHFPITPDQLRGRWRFLGLEAGRHCVEGFEVLAADVTHKGGRTFGYRVSVGTGDRIRTVAYIPDYWQTEAPAEPTTLVADADLLLHDAQHLDSELRSKAYLGHSTVEYAVDLAARHRVGHLALFHHDPARTDDEIDTVVSALEHSGVDVSAASAGRCYRF